MSINQELLDLTAVVFKNCSCLGENILMIGKSGTGRRSALKIAAALLSAKLLVPASEQRIQLNMDLKMAIQLAGLDGEQVLLVINDYIFEDRNNVNIIGMLMASGEVPGLYTSVEIDSLVKNLKDEAERFNFEGSLFEFFVKRNYS